MVRNNSELGEEDEVIREEFLRGGEHGLVVLLLAEQRRGWSLMISVLAQRAASKDEEGAARCPSCSQNAHGETVLVRCAQ